MVELPMEIIHNIITLATPFPSFENNDRVDFLLPLCHLHSSLARHAQRLLFTHPVLNSESAVERFADTIEDEDIKFKSMVRAIRMSMLYDYNGCLHRIIRECVEIREMLLCYVHEIDFADFAQLKSQYCWYCWRGTRFSDCSLIAWCTAAYSRARPDGLSRFRPRRGD